MHSALGIRKSVSVVRSRVKIGHTRRRKIGVALDRREIYRLQNLFRIIFRASRMYGRNKGIRALLNEVIRLTRNGCYRGRQRVISVHLDSNRILVVHRSIYRRSRRNSVCTVAAHNGSRIGSILSALGNSEIFEDYVRVRPALDAEVPRPTGSYNVRVFVCIVGFYVVGLAVYAHLSVFPLTVSDEKLDANVLLIGYRRILRVLSERRTYYIRAFGIRIIACRVNTQVCTAVGSDLERAVIYILVADLTYVGIAWNNARRLQNIHTGVDPEREVHDIALGRIKLNVRHKISFCGVRRVIKTVVNVGYTVGIRCAYVKIIDSRRRKLRVAFDP